MSSQWHTNKKVVGSFTYKYEMYEYVPDLEKKQVLYYKLY